VAGSGLGTRSVTKRSHAEARRQAKSTLAVRAPLAASTAVASVRAHLAQPRAEGPPLSRRHGEARQHDRAMAAAVIETPLIVCGNEDQQLPALRTGLCQAWIQHRRRVTRTPTEPGGRPARQASVSRMAGVERNRCQRAPRQTSITCRRAVLRRGQHDRLGATITVWWAMPRWSAATAGKNQMKAARCAGVGESGCEPPGDRTQDPLIKSQMLYH
jgi:hypothetical protein